MPQRRTRIQIGPGGVVYAFATGLIFFAATSTQANLLFWAFGLMIGALVASIAVALLLMRRLSVERLLPSHAVAGEPLTIRYQITNASRLPVFGVIIHESWGRGRRAWRRQGPIADEPQRLRARPTGYILHLGGRQTIHAQAPCWPLRRGTVGFERIILSSAFPFAILRKTIEFHAPTSLLVYPQIYRLDRRLLHHVSRFGQGDVQRMQRGGGSEEFFGIRPYRPGDSLRRIHWRRSARTGELVSREYIQQQRPSVTLLLDLRQPNADTAPSTWPDDAVEHAISLAASLLCEAQLAGCQIGLMVAGTACPSFSPHHTLPHRLRMLEALAKLTPAVPGGEPVAPGWASVVVWPGDVQSYPGPARQLSQVLGAQDIQRYVVGGAQARDLLKTRPVNTTARTSLVPTSSPPPASSR